MLLYLQYNNHFICSHTTSPNAFTLFRAYCSCQYIIHRREQCRRLQIYEQVQRARQLRASLEEAANLADALPDNSSTSYSEAMSILQSSLPQINQLVHLTEAIRGKQTVEDPAEYDKWHKWMDIRNNSEEAQQKREQRTLRRQLRDFAREKNPDLDPIDELLEARHDSLIPKPNKDNVHSKCGEINDPDEWEMGADVEDDTDDVMSDNYEYDAGNDDGEFIPKAYQLEVESESDSDMILQRQRNSRRSSKRVKADVPPSNADIDHQPDPNEIWAKRQAMAISREISDVPPLAHRLFPLESAKKKAKLHTDRKSDRGILSDSPSIKRAKARKNPPETIVTVSNNILRKAPPETMPAEDLATYAAVAEARAKAAAFASFQSAAKAQAKRPAKPSNSSKGRPSKKKCHDCRNATTRYRSCSYWKLTGKCKKSFCIDCLSSKYTLGDDVKSPTNEDGVSLDEIIMCAALDAEWHCPSCLGTCMCNLCVKERKREEEREKVRDDAERKSSRRSAGSTYSNFF